VRPIPSKAFFASSMAMFACPRSQIRTQSSAKATTPYPFDLSCFKTLLTEAINRIELSGDPYGTPVFHSGKY